MTLTGTFVVFQNKSDIKLVNNTRGMVLERVVELTSKMNHVHSLAMTTLWAATVSGRKKWKQSMVTIYLSGLSNHKRQTSDLTIEALQ